MAGNQKGGTGIKPVPPANFDKFNSQLNRFLSEYTLSTIKPWELNYFFRYLLKEIDRWQYNEEKSLQFLDFVAERLHDSQGRIRSALPSIMRKYKAVFRVAREEQQSGVASVESQEQLAAANRAAENALEDVKVTDEPITIREGSASE